jgi:hypothetical protein
MTYQDDYWTVAGMPGHAFKTSSRTITTTDRTWICKCGQTFPTAREMDAHRNAYRMEELQCALDAAESQRDTLRTALIEAQSWVMSHPGEHHLDTWSLLRWRIHQAIRGDEAMSDDVTNPLVAENQRLRAALIEARSWIEAGEEGGSSVWRHVRRVELTDRIREALEAGK